MLSAKSNSEEQASLADLAQKSISEIQAYAESDEPDDQLIALNTILFTLTVGFLISHWLLSGNSVFGLQGILILGLSMLFAAIFALGYIKLIEPMRDLGGENLTGLRLAILVEFFALSGAFLGLIFVEELLVRAAFVLIISQTFIPLIGGAIPISDSLPADSGEELNLWTVLGRINTVAGILTILVNGLGFAFKYLG